MFSKIIRSNDWWQPKIFPILSIGYATLLISNKNLFEAGSKILFILTALLPGAIYVSVLNDLTDEEADKAAGKLEQHAIISPRIRLLTLCFCLIIGLSVIFNLLPDRNSIVIYILCWVTFSMYSIPPIRLKTRGLSGLIADASGAHLFPILFVILSLYYSTNQIYFWPWILFGGLWSFSWGLRGILGHQYYDRKSDLSVGLNTYATRITVDKIKVISNIIFIVELIAFAIMLLIVKNILSIVFFVIYFLLIIYRYKRYNSKPNIIRPLRQGSYVLIMDQYYQEFFPFALLITAALNQKFSWIILLIHSLLYYGINIFAFSSRIISKLTRF